MLFFRTFYSSKNIEKSCIMVSTKILNSTIVFNIDNIKKYFKISISEWFLKDHVTGVMHILFLNILN